MGTFTFSLLPYLQYAPSTFSWYKFFHDSHGGCCLSECTVEEFLLYHFFKITFTNLLLYGISRLCFDPPPGPVTEMLGPGTLSISGGSVVWGDPRDEKSRALNIANKQITPFVRSVFLLLFSAPLNPWPLLACSLGFTPTIGFASLYPSVPPCGIWFLPFPLWLTVHSFKNHS